MSANDHYVLIEIPGLRSDYEKVGGLVYFGRMLDKIRQLKLGFPLPFWLR